VNALLNQIAGKTHNGAASETPTVFGMNFQALYAGEILVEPGVGNGGYKNGAGEPSEELLKEIQFVDASIGDIVNALKDRGIYDQTLIIDTAKHGESPIDPKLYQADTANTPATLLGSAIPFSESPLNSTGIGATEDDVSVLWLKKGASVNTAVDLLEKNLTAIGMGQLYYGSSLALNYNVGGTGPGEDPRSPDIIVTPNIGVTYVGGSSVLGDHGGFAHDDTNVIMLVEHPHFRAQTVSSAATTAQVAPTILKALGLNPKALDAVRAEGTAVLPEVQDQLDRYHW
jgi:arylsulfatase A-like enzyme